MAQRTKRGRFNMVFGLLLLAAVVLIAAVYLHNHTISVLEPRGVVGEKEKHLIIIGALLSCIVVIPVFIMTTVIAYKYREGNHEAKYSPDWDRSRFFETVWWGIPMIIIGVLSLITWNSAHDLDPYKSLNSNAKPITIQVISLDWKWLFIYPKQSVATVNFVQFPVDTPIDFEITSDSVMNSFWVPQLGGQVYAMPGMATHLNLMAGQAGDFSGSSANISGSGFSGMTFTARASSSIDFAGWLNQVRLSPKKLTRAEYSQLAKPSKYNSPTFYSGGQTGLFNSVTMKYLLPASQITQSVHGVGM